MFQFGAKGMTNFQIILLWNAKGNFYILILFKKFYVIIDIIVIHMICMCIVHKNCIILLFHNQAPFYTSRIIVRLIPRAPLKTTSKDLGWRAFPLMKFWKCQKLNSLFLDLGFLELPKHSWNFQILSIIKKFKNWKILLKNSWKNSTPFGRRNWNIGTPLALGMPSWTIGTPLASWHDYRHIGM